MEVQAYPTFALLGPNGMLLGTSSGMVKKEKGERSTVKDIQNIVDSLRNRAAQR